MAFQRSNSIAMGSPLLTRSFIIIQIAPWHYHQNAHFALTTKGRLVETHKKKQIQLSAGGLLYNHTDEPHCNSKYSDLVAALHIEGVKQIRNPIIILIKN